MANQFRYRSKVPPLITNTLIPLLRGQAYQNVTRLLAGASRGMKQMGVVEYGPSHDPGLWWEALGSNRNRWTPQIRRLFDNRVTALQVVARELENQVPGFQGLSQRFDYNPSHHALDRTTGGVVVDWNERVGGAHANPFAHIGDPAFRAPQDLVRVVMHEGRHLQQSMRGGDFNRSSVLAEADAYLFDLEHRNLSGINSQRITSTAQQFRILLDVNDRLAAGQRVDPFYSRDASQGGMGIRESMSSLRRADLELRWKFIEPDIRREMNTFSANRYWLNRAVGFQPYWQAGYNPSNRLRSLWERG